METSPAPYGCARRLYHHGGCHNVGEETGLRIYLPGKANNELWKVLY